MKSKKKILVCLIMTMVMSIFGVTCYATDSTPQYAITEENVIIDYVEYEIIDNTIFYEGKTYELIDYTLVAHDEKGKILLVLPIEENRIKDPARIKALNDKVRGVEGSEKSIPSNPEDLPYTDSVSEGQWNVETPAFNLIDGEFYRVTNLKLSEFSNNEKEFSVGFMYGTISGNWYEHDYDSNYDFGNNNTARYLNATGMRYGLFYLANLYGDPSPSYTYRIYLSAA